MNQTFFNHPSVLAFNCIILFVILLFSSLKMPPIRTGSICKIYGDFLNSFHLSFLRFLGRLERNKNRKGRRKVSVLFHQACLINKYINRDIGPAVRVFANGPGDLGSIPGRVIPKTLKMELDTTLSIIRYGSRVKWSNPGNGVAPYTLV